MARGYLKRLDSGFQGKLRAESVMNKSEIEELIKKGESKTVEFKETFDNRTVETAVAFTNTKGGHIFIGVSDQGAKKGVQIGKETLIS